MSLQLVLSHRFKKELNEKCSASLKGCAAFFVELILAKLAGLFPRLTD